MSKFSVGDRVRIISDCYSYGKRGVIRDVIQNYYGRSDYYVYNVKIDNGGLYNYNESSLELCDEYGNKKGANKMAKLTGYKRVAEIMITGRSYYYALYDEDIAVGDRVLVTGRASGQLYSVWNVWSLQDAADRYKGNINEEVICKVDQSAYEKRVADRAEKDKLRKEMDAMIKQMDEAQKYRMYADQNPMLAELLKKFETLEG